MAPFGYRLTVRNGKFVAIRGAGDANLFEHLPTENASEHVFKDDGWEVTIVDNSDMPCWKIGVRYHRTDDGTGITDRGERYPYSNYPYVDDGDLFLFVTSDGQPKSTFCYRNLQYTMMRLFGITSISYREVDGNSYQTHWAHLEQAFALTRYFTDGKVYLTFNDVRIADFNDAALNGKEGKLNAEISHATWAVRADLKCTDKSEIMPSACLLVKDEATAVSIIPKLQHYLETCRCHNFYEMLDRRLP